MDLDAFVAAHRAEWDRLEQLSRRPGRLSGAEADELVELYQVTATHLSAVRSAAPDPALVGRLSSLLARARSAVTGTRPSAWSDVARFLGVVFPAAAYRARWWWLGTGAGFVLLATALGSWVAANPSVQAAIASPEQIQQLVQQDFASYYSSNPAGSFAFQVWTNNAWVAALSIAFGAFLGLPVLWVLAQNMANVAVAGGLMAANDRLDLFFGLILPHGMLELTAVFLAAAVGLRLGWTVIDPGDRPRGEAVAEEGRAAGAVALGLVPVLLVSGLVEAFVTPSGLPTWARVGIGVLVWAAFLAWSLGLGRRAVQSGESGDLDREESGDRLPWAA